MSRAVAIALLLLGPQPLSAQPRWPRVHIPQAAGAELVRQALSGASRRLESPKCRRLFEELRDEHGRPLRARLDALQKSEADYLALVVFADGSETRQCRERATIAYTERGSRVVLVCGSRFERAWHKSRLTAEAVVIHEALHTLGLGENPPSS